MSLYTIFCLRPEVVDPMQSLIVVTYQYHTVNDLTEDFFVLTTQGYEDGDESSAGAAMQKKRRGSAASSQGSKASATAGTGDKQTLKSEKEDGEKDEYGDDFEEDKTEGKKEKNEASKSRVDFFLQVLIYF